MIILGIDPGLQKTGWGVLQKDGQTCRFIACGLIKTKAADPLADRLAALDRGLAEVIKLYKPECAAVEETFVNKNPASALKLGQARGVCLLAPARAGLPVHEYGANQVKKSLTGAGHAAKQQMGMMVKVLMPNATPNSEDEADALAIAICHAHHS